MKRTRLRLAAWIAAALAFAGLSLDCASTTVVAAEAPPSAALGRWVFWPDYRLGQEAANYPGPRDPYPATPFELVDVESEPLLFLGQRPTERVARLLPGERIPDGAFSVELWLVDHVNQAVGAIATVKGRTGIEPPAWLVGYHDRKVHFVLRTAGGAAPVRLAAETAKGWKRYWRHVVATYDGGMARLFVNGELEAESAAGSGPIALPPSPELEFAAYLSREPHMQLGNLLREARLHSRALSPAEIRTQFEALCQQVEAGIIDSHRFHFIAGPALSAVTRDSIGLMWETDRPARAVVHYGRQVPYDQAQRLGEPRQIHELTLSGLSADSSYFYEVVATDAEGTEIRSGPLTFQTAVDAGDAFAFVVIGDTEARPHINDVLAKAIWGERPNFLVHVGDLTDGGQHGHKFEWNLEYWLGMNQLLGRVPLFPVPGNGESDLHHYTRYHVLPAPENFYRFTYGDADFFMLDSNRPMGPGSAQYAWLERELAASTARWKFAAHHHPTYTSDEDDYGNTWRGSSELGDTKVRSIVPLYERYGVDIVFFGHMHAYERTWPVADGGLNSQRGVRYVQTGGAGGNFEQAGPTRTWFAAQHHRGHHYCLLTLHQDVLSFRMFDLDGRLRDFFEIRKAAAAASPAR